MKILCPHCQKEFDHNTKAVDEFGFTEKSKGSFIAETIAQAASGISMVSLMQKVDKKYPDKNNLGRIQSVVNKLRKNGKLNMEGGTLSMVASK